MRENKYIMLEKATESILEILDHQSSLYFRDVFMEKHWKSVISRSICDYFFDAQNKATSPSEVSYRNVFLTKSINSFL